MHDSVQTSLCNKLALEHVVPVRDWQLTCKDGCLSVISVIYDLLKIVLQLPFQSDHAKVVYDKQVVCVELAEEVGLPSFEMYELEVLDEHVHREIKHLDAIAATVPCGLTSQSGLWDYIYGDQFPDEEEYNEKVLPIRLKLDVYYVKHASFFGDIKLIIWTVLAILYTACGKYPQWMHDRLVSYAEGDQDVDFGKRL